MQSDCNPLYEKNGGAEARNINALGKPMTSHSLAFVSQRSDRFVSGRSTISRPHLFQPFFRGAVRRSQQGLGLFTVSEIAKAHGGMVEVTPDESRPGSRSACTVDPDEYGSADNASVRCRVSIL